MPIMVGPLPFGDGVMMERAYLEAAPAADPAFDLKTRTLVAIEAGRSWAKRGELLGGSPGCVCGLSRARADSAQDGTAAGAAALADAAARRPHGRARPPGPGRGGGGDWKSWPPPPMPNAELLLGVFLRYPGGGAEVPGGAAAPAAASAESASHGAAAKGRRGRRERRCLLGPP